MSTPFDDRGGVFVDLINDHDQHSLWPAAAEIPAGWSIAYEQNGRQACIEYIGRNWTDMRPTTGAEIQRAYGAVNYALSLGVPLVVAGDSEEKPEIAARVAWAGAGINLGTGRPSASQIREAVRAVLTKPQYRERAQALRTAFARHNAPDEIAELVEDLAAGWTAANSRGTRLVSACRTTDSEGQSGP